MGDSHRFPLGLWHAFRKQIDAALCGGDQATRLVCPAREVYEAHTLAPKRQRVEISERRIKTCLIEHDAGGHP